MTTLIRRLPWLVAGLALLIGLTVFLRRPADVAVVMPERREVVELVVASGTVNAVRRTSIGTESAGIVGTLDVDEGDRVRAGQLLGRLTQGETDARLAQTRAALDAADRTLRAEQAVLAKNGQEVDRLRPLASAGQVSAAELERAEADFAVQVARVEAAVARLAEARAEVARVAPDFARRELRAPFDGLITRRHVEPGTPVGGAQGWFDIAERGGDTEIEVETDENNLGKLAAGQPVIAVSPAWPERPFGGRVRQVGPFVDSDRGVVKVRIVPDEVPDFVLPNMTVDVSIEVRRIDDALALPAGAVALQARPPYVHEVGADGRVSRRTVSVLGRNPDWVAVGDIAEGARVVASLAGVRPGTRVRATAAAQAAEVPGRPVR